MTGAENGDDVVKPAAAEEEDGDTKINPGPAPRVALNAPCSLSTHTSTPSLEQAYLDSPKLDNQLLN